MRFVVVVGGALVVGSYVFRPRIKPKKIPAHNMPVFKSLVPFTEYVKARLLYALVPWSILKYIVLEASPDVSALLDERDVTGKSPYKFKEVVAGQIWTVEYRYQMEKNVAWLVLASAKQNEEQLLSAVPEEDRAMLKGDLERCRRCALIPPEEGVKGAYYKDSLALDSWMTVAKLADGGLILYSPIKIDGADGEVARWLTSLGGPVRAIFAPSGAHHFFVKGAQEVFPEALVFTGDSAFVKMAKAGVRVDVDYTTHGGMMFLMQIFATSLIPCLCDGDPNQELVLFHTPSGTCLVTDLLYTKYDLNRGKARSDGMEKSERDIRVESDPEMWPLRLFNANWITPSPNGLLPRYRYATFDKSVWRPGKPPTDASSAHRFSHALRIVLDTGAKLGTQRCVACHLDEPISWQQADKLIRAHWDFLFTE